MAVRKAGKKAARKKAGGKKAARKPVARKVAAKKTGSRGKSLGQQLDDLLEGLGVNPKGRIKLLGIDK